LFQIYGKLLDLIVVSITFIPISMTFLKSEEDDLSAYASLFWMLLILIQCSKSFWQAARKHSKMEDAKTMAQGEPQIEDICQNCASDIFSSDHDVCYGLICEKALSVKKKNEALNCKIPCV
jgi:hypothetical protein